MHCHCKAFGIGNSMNLENYEQWSAIGSIIQGISSFFTLIFIAVSSSKFINQWHKQKKLEIVVNGTEKVLISLNAIYINFEEISKANDYMINYFGFCYRRNSFDKQSDYLKDSENLPNELQEIYDSRTNKYYDNIIEHIKITDPLSMVYFDKNISTIIRKFLSDVRESCYHPNYVIEIAPLLVSWDEYNKRVKDAEIEIFKLSSEIRKNKEKIDSYLVKNIQLELR
jgi:hypothetical protein